jgi:signal transduction histidine kinase/ActR/RegA family two-component response regulator
MSGKRSGNSVAKRAIDPALRDIVALSMLPGIWAGAPPERIAESLAAALFTTIDARLVYVSFADEDKQPFAAVAQVDRYRTNPTLAGQIGPAIFEWAQQHDPDEILFLRETDGESTLRIATRPIGRNAELGVIAAAFWDETSPTPADNLVLNVAVSQTVIAVQNARLLRSVQASRKQAEAANRMKDEFLATVSHELRTPLTAILGWANMLRTGELDSSQTKLAVETIERNARLQDQLVNDLLDLGRITTGKLRLNVSPIDPISPLEAAVEALRPAAEAKGIRIQKIIDTSVGAISGDPERLQQVVWNLLSNAIKFTAKNGRIQVRLERINSHLEIIVSDTGIGIKQEFLPFVFDRFRQGDSAPTRSHGGLGLGLAIVRHLVELHGGEVHADSHGEGQGATFTVKLPVIPVYQRQEIEERVHPRIAALLPQIEATDRIDGVRVLVVDDEPDTRELLKTMLASCGAEVTMAASAKLALEEMQRSQFDVIVSDIGMPEVDGYELMQRIRCLPVELGGKTPAVALTAYARSEDRLRALRVGYKMHVSKPIERAELIVVVASIVDRSHSA